MIQSLTATLTCPKCDSAQTATMPEDSCQYFYTCKSCDEVIKPKKGDCCVFCSYADSKCPPKQSKP